jgi:DNA-binding Lrp family transcriptional regulator
MRLVVPPCLRRVKRLEAEGYITGYRAVLSPKLTGRGFEVMVAVDINATDRQTVDDFEAAIVSFDEVVAVRLFGQPDHLVHVAVADAVEYEAFLTASSSACPRSTAPSRTRR